MSPQRMDVRSDTTATAFSSFFEFVELLAVSVAVAFDLSDRDGATSTSRNII